jgi:hypothetical protein
VETLTITTPFSLSAAASRPCHSGGAAQGELAAAAPFEIGEHAVSPLGVQRVEAALEKALVIHSGPC